MERYRDDPDAWVAIITGVDDAFCAGGDLRDFIPLLTASAPEDRGRFESASEAVLRNLEIYKPIIWTATSAAAAARSSRTNAIGRVVFAWYASYRSWLMPLTSCQSRP